MVHCFAVLQMNKLQQAISDCSAALKLDEKYLKALLRRAKCHSDLNMLEEAVLDYEKACLLERSRGQTIFTLG